MGEVEERGERLLDLLYRAARIFVAVVERRAQRDDVLNDRERNRPGDAKRLVDGNDFYARYSHVHRPIQFPTYCIISCSDSRVCPELIFAASSGTCFCYRSAGAVVGNLGIGTLDIGADLIKVRHIITLGHKRCAALRSAINGVEGVPQRKIRRLLSWYEALTNDTSRSSRSLARAQAMKLMSKEYGKLGDLVRLGDLRVSYGVFSEDTGKVRLWSLDPCDILYTRRIR